MRQSWIQVDTLAGEAIPAGDVRLIPLAQSTKVGPPGTLIGLFWDRPVAVVVRGSRGGQQVLPIVDITRRAQLILLGIGLLGSFLLWLAFGRQR